MEIKNQLKEMFQMQKSLNENILKEFGKLSMTSNKLQMAITDELGELTHELKGDWCWWKKTQPPVDRKRVLEELVDVYHFVMTWELRYGPVAGDIKGILEYYKDAIDEYETDISTLELHKLICIVIFRKNKLMNLLVLSRRLNSHLMKSIKNTLERTKSIMKDLKMGIDYDR